MRAYLRWALSPQGGIPMLIIIGAGQLALAVVGMVA